MIVDVCVSSGRPVRQAGTSNPFREFGRRLPEALFVPRSILFPKRMDSRTHKCDQFRIRWLVATLSRG